MPDLAYFLQLIVFILPAYIANSSPVLFGGGVPVDFGRKLPDRQRILGKGKTIRGTLAGFTCGSLTGFLIAFLSNQPDYFILGPVLSAGTLAGDMLGSFIKRRTKMKQGQPSFLMDQLLFLAGALLLAYPFLLKPNPVVTLTLEGIAFLFILTYFVHVAANWIANRLGLKKVPW